MLTRSGELGQTTDYGSYITPPFTEDIHFFKPLTSVYFHFLYGEVFSCVATVSLYFAYKRMIIVHIETIIEIVQVRIL